LVSALKFAPTSSACASACLGLDVTKMLNALTPALPLAFTFLPLTCPIMPVLPAEAATPAALLRRARRELAAETRRRLFWSAKTANGDTAMHVAVDEWRFVDVHPGVDDGDSSAWALKALVEDGVVELTAQNARGQTALMQACSHARPGMALYLLSQGVEALP
jgi:ankyrin repeat protein